MKNTRSNNVLTLGENGELLEYDGSISMRQNLAAATYDINNAVQLHPGKTIDTTNRTIFNKAKMHQFDPEGFRNHQPLQRDIFHTDPYITCSNCNALLFVDVSLIKRMLVIPSQLSNTLQIDELPSAQSHLITTNHSIGYQEAKASTSSRKEQSSINIIQRLPTESLPPCVQCKEANCFVIGSHDFSEDIKKREIMKKEKIRIQTAAVVKIQRKYRRYLRKMYGKALSNAFLADKYYKYKAAVRINATARGRLGRRQAKTEKAIAIIAKAHPLLIRFALKSMLNRPKTFWYKRQSDIDLLLGNYLLFVERTGYQPIRLAVERNLQEIAYRIEYRKHTLLLLIQKKWRGFMTRRMVKYFRTELVFIFQLKLTHILKIQRAYRGHYVRLRVIPKLKEERFNEKMIKNYRQEISKIKSEKLKTENTNPRLKLLYKTEFSNEKTLRYTSVLPYTNHKTKEYWDSNYIDDKNFLRNDMIACINKEKRIMFDKKLEMEEIYARKAFILSRIDEVGPLGYGLRNISIDFKDQIWYDLTHVQYRQSTVKVDNSLISNNDDDNNQSKSYENSTYSKNKLSSTSYKSQASHNSSKKSIQNNSNDEYDNVSIASSLSYESSFLPLPSINKYSMSSSISSINIIQKIIPKKNNVLKARDSSRSKSMRIYFQQEMDEIVQIFIEKQEQHEVAEDVKIRVRNKLINDIKEFNNDKIQILSRSSTLDGMPRDDKHNKKIIINKNNNNIYSNQSITFDSNDDNSQDSNFLHLNSPTKKSNGNDLSKLNNNNNNNNNNKMTSTTNNMLSHSNSSSSINSNNKLLNKSVTINDSQSKFENKLIKPANKKIAIIKGYKYPDELNFNSMEWLFSDDKY
eukprot:gene7451-10157_t